MKQESILAGVAVVASAATVVAPPAAAASNNFARNIWSTASFLDQSSRLASHRSRSRRLREYARSEALEQTVAANAIAALMDSMQGDRQAAAKVEDAASPGHVIALPFRAAASVSSGMADAIDGLQTGRSVAVDTSAERPPTPLKTITVPSLTANLDRMAGMSGRAFDDFYRATQVDALLQLSTLYASYIQSGGDPGLRALAVRELPKVNGRLALIKSLR